MKVVGKAIYLFLIAVVAISAAPRGSKATSTAEIDAWMQRLIVLKPRFRARANLRSRLREYWFFPL
jgi:hypothetical protein